MSNEPKQGATDGDGDPIADVQNLKNEVREVVDEVESDAKSTVGKHLLPIAHDAAVVAFEEVEAHLAGYAASGSAISGTEAKRIAKLLAELQSLLGLDPAQPPQAKGAAAK